MKKKIVEVLEHIVGKIPSKIKWVVFGSSNMLLQGVKLNTDPDDVDILTDNAGLSNFLKMFNKNKDLKRNYKGVDGKNYFQEIKLKINDIEISIMTEEILKPDKRIFDEGFRSKYITNNKIPLMNLRKQLLGMKRIYDSRGDKPDNPGGRKLKIELLEKYLNLNTNYK